jgi:hypothetical protein
MPRVSHTGTGPVPLPLALRLSCRLCVQVCRLELGQVANVAWTCHSPTQGQGAVCKFKRSIRLQVQLAGFASPYFIRPVSPSTTIPFLSLSRHGTPQLPVQSFSSPAIPFTCRVAS